MSNSGIPSSLSAQRSIQTIASAIARLRRLSQLDIQAGWRVYDQDLAPEVALSPFDWRQWPMGQLNDRRHIAWEKGRRALWLCQQVVAPADLEGYSIAGLTLKLALRWWADRVRIFVNGQFVQAGDLFDCFTRIGLSESVSPGQPIKVGLRLLSPGHDNGALVYSHLVFEAPCNADVICPEPGFVADELAVLQRYLAQFAPARLPTLATAIGQLDWSVLGDRSQFQPSLAALRDTLRPLGDWLKHRQIYCLGHAHLDLAWLWPLRDTWQAAERTFESVLSLQQDFPELIYTHSSPALFAWLEANRPDLFAQIQQQVIAGRWEIAAGLWVEPELNIVSGESIARQVLYGQRYVQEKFGQISKIAWLPDSFGFCWQLPQILKQGGIEYFATQKLQWNDTTHFPHALFWWRAPDGTQLLSLTLPPIGADIDPIKMADCACDWEAKTGITQAFWLPGVGDHGGGPTRDMLEKARRWARSPLFPQLGFGTAVGFLEQVEVAGEMGRWGDGGDGEDGEDGEIGDAQVQNPKSKIQNPKSLPVWNDELYLELHRGCYTTHADQKQQNRRYEDLLYQAELFAAIATLTTGQTYPKAALEAVWKKMLLNQFHDILPGSSIPEVFVDANRDWAVVKQRGEQILQDSFKAIANQIDLPEPPEASAIAVIIFNPLNWTRSERVEIYPPYSPQPGCHWQILTLTGQPLSIQPAACHTLPPPSRISEPTTLLFLAENIPSIGYRIFWLTQTPDANDSTAPILHAAPNLTAAEADWILENNCLRVTVAPETGDLASVFDKFNQREVLSGPGNQLQAFQDQGQYWDAWNIAPDYTEHPLPPTQLKTIYWLEQGPIRFRLRVVRQLGRSEFYQDYILEADSPILKIATTVDWQESQVLVKAAFPMTVQAAAATYEIPYGAIARSTQPQTPQEKAKWEVPALRWADLSQADYGVSLLNDCKYGYDSQPNQIRLTLLKAPLWPDPTADRGIHTFTYALYPHSGNWQAAETVRRGYELNRPLQVWLRPNTAQKPRSTQDLLNPSASFLNLGENSLILSAFKQSETDPDQFVLRCYESQGVAIQLAFQSSLNLQISDSVDLLEQSNQQPLNHNDLQVQPWKIVSLAVCRNG